MTAVPRVRRPIAGLRLLAHHRGCGTATSATGEAARRRASPVCRRSTARGGVLLPKPATSGRVHSLPGWLCGCTAETGPRWAECPVVPFVAPFEVGTTRYFWDELTTALPLARSPSGDSYLGLAPTLEDFNHLAVDQAPGTTPVPRVLPGLVLLFMIWVTSLSPTATGGPTLIRARLPATHSFLEHACSRFLGVEARMSPLPTQRSYSRFGTVSQIIHSQALPHDGLGLSQLSSSRSVVSMAPEWRNRYPGSDIGPGPPCHHGRGSLREPG
jgi:hypothetical protein